MAQYTRTETLDQIEGHAKNMRHCSADLLDAIDTEQWKRAAHFAQDAKWHATRLQMLTTTLATGDLLAPKVASRG